MTSDSTISRDSPGFSTSHTRKNDAQEGIVNETADRNGGFDHIDEKKVLRKMDLHLLPMVTLLYLLSFLDRGNIGNANIEGLTASLHMTGPQYNWTLTVFFFTYAALQVPSNLLLKRLRPSVWLPIIMIAWGTVMTLMGIVQNFKGLLTARLFLGAAEAGLFPGVAYYITWWYKREELQFRMALFVSAAGVAGAFSGLFAFVIAKMDGVGGVDGWRWIFILEGILTVLVACAAFFTIYDFPETAKFLAADERAWIVHRLKYQGSNGSGHMVAESEHFEWKYVRDAFTDWQIYLQILVYWGVDCPLYGIALFLPSIVKELGYSSSTTQLLTVPIYVTACLIAVIVAWFSDRKGQRSPFIIPSLCVIAIGFLICIIAGSRGSQGAVYAGVFISVCGIYPAGAGMVVWNSNNLAGSYKRSTGMALQIGIGNLAGAMASNFYRTKNAPKYFLGHSLELGFVALGLLAAVILRLSYQKINRKRDEDPVDHYSNEEMSRMGDRAPTFRYIL